MGLQAASSEEEKGDILVISSRSKEEDQPPGPALLAEARDRDPKSADLWSGAADSPAEERARAFHGAPCCFQQGPLVLGRPQRGGLPLVRGGGIIRPRQGRPGLGVVTPGTTYGGAPYSCNDSSCSSQEDAAAKPGDLELAVA